MKYDVFISYSSHDQKVVEGLCAYLEQNNIRCFVAYRDIPKTKVWASAIVEAIEESHMMLVVFSEHFNNSNQVDREIELASEDRKPILTLRISSDDFKGAKKYYLKNIHWIDAFPNPEDGFANVVDSIKKLLGVKTEHIAEQPKRSSRNVGVWICRYVLLPMVVILGLVGFVNSAIEYFCDREAKYEVGDYYDVGNVQGVVFEVWNEGQNGKIISLHQNKCDWWKAVEWCENYGNGWRLPNKSELLMVHNNRAIITNQLMSLQMPALDGDCYWSSDICHNEESMAWTIGMTYGREYTRDMNRIYPVQAVYTF